MRILRWLKRKLRRGRRRYSPYSGPRLFGKDGLKKFTVDRWAHLQGMSREEIEERVTKAFIESSEIKQP